MKLARRWRNSLAAIAMLAASVAAQAAEVRVVVFFNPHFDHYFLSTDPAEIAALDDRTPSLYAPSVTWARTGTRYRVQDAPGDGTVPVCRFFTAKFAGRGTHVFTASPAECEWLKSSPDWIYEGIAFHARPPAADGTCGAGFAAIRRYFNNGRGGAPNHAYTHDTIQGGRLQAAGFTPEEVAFCVPTTSSESAARTGLLIGTTWDFPAFPDVYGPSSLHIAFVDAVRKGFNSKLASHDLRQIEYYVYYAFNDAWTTYTGWDPLANGYVLIGSSGFEGVEAIAYKFDSVDGQSLPVCSHIVSLNRVNAYQVHAFQPYLWTGCRPGQMVRG